jgi:hypothetical protein
MKKRISYFVLSLSFAVFGLVGPASALADSTSNSSTTDDSTSRTTRIDAYKKGFKDALTAATKVRIAERCVAAQALVKAKSANNKVTTNLRTTAYDTIVTDLEDLSTALEAKDIDVMTLDANIATLKTKITVFKTANTTYQQALQDLAAMDCKTDPTGFKATLDIVRTDQAALLNSALDIRTYLSGTVKPTLLALKEAAKTTSAATN